MEVPSSVPLVSFKTQPADGAGGSGNPPRCSWDVATQLRCPTHRCCRDPVAPPPLVSGAPRRAPSSAAVGRGGVLVSAISAISVRRLSLVTWCPRGSGPALPPHTPCSQRAWPRGAQHGGGCEVAPLRQLALPCGVRQLAGFRAHGRPPPSADAGPARAPGAAGTARRSVRPAPFAFVFQFFVSPHLATFVLSVVPPVSVLAVLYGRYLRKLSKRTQDSLARATQVRALPGGASVPKVLPAPHAGPQGPGSLEHAAFSARGPPRRQGRPARHRHASVLTSTAPRGTRKLITRPERRVTPRTQNCGMPRTQNTA